MTRQGSPGPTPAPVRPAARWFLRLQGPDSPALTPEELEQWEQFARDPAQLKELIEIKELWQAARAVGGPAMPTAAELAADDFDESMSVREWQARCRSLERARSTRFVSAARWLALAASVVAAVGVAFYAPSWLRSGTPEQTQVFATQRAEQRSVELADGSVVTLGARTEIDTRISAAERVVVLKHGEAWFKVAHEKRRPFKVLAGEGVITAVGTEFNVRRDLDGDLDRITVTVGDGIVDVALRSDIVEAHAPSDGGAGNPITQWKPARLAKGQELAYTRGGERSPIRQVDIEAAAAWKEGRLEYIHQPLQAVVASVNRYSGKPIVLADDSVASIDFSGTVFEEQIDKWIRALEAAFPIEVIELDDRILIRSHVFDLSCRDIRRRLPRGVEAQKE
ncbi:MAG TPA: FecR domain-containing protein [Steroidobacter sp.]